VPRSAARRKLAEVESRSEPRCLHDRLNEDGICRHCGADCRGSIHG
jgi:hypothetical protein